uniref:Uncharacterized protein n=1 Tax=Arundo donax TaxID=35708 RepID=A0A0A8YDP7_ARUDO
MICGHPNLVMHCGRNGRPVLPGDCLIM